MNDFPIVHFGEHGDFSNKEDLYYEIWIFR